MPVNTSFGRLWPHCDAKYHLVTVIAPISGARFPVHSGIAPLVAEGLRRQELGIGGPAYLCDPSQCGGNNCRKIAGTESPSNHSGALAIDDNWRDNPFKKGARYKMPEWVWRMWEWLGFYWGGRYHDYMHIEYLKTPAMARARMIELGLLGGGGGGTGGTVLKLGSKGPEVRRLQELLKIGIDGSFGRDTEKAVRIFQQHNGLTADGICGLATWAKLLEEDDMNGDQNRKLDETHGMLQELRSALVHHTIQSRLEPGKYNTAIFLSAIHGDIWDKFTALNTRLDTLEAALTKKTS